MLDWCALSFDGAIALNTYVHALPDIDECLEGNHNCSEYADCENKHGGFNCKCYTGYEGDGMTCKRK